MSIATIRSIINHVEMHSAAPRAEAVLVGMYTLRNAVEEASRLRAALAAAQAELAAVRCGYQPGDVVEICSEEDGLGLETWQPATVGEPYESLPGHVRIHQPGYEGAWPLRDVRRPRPKPAGWA